MATTSRNGMGVDRAANHCVDSRQLALRFAQCLLLSDRERRKQSGRDGEQVFAELVLWLPKRKSCGAKPANEAGEVVGLLIVGLLLMSTLWCIAFARDFARDDRNDLLREGLRVIECEP